MRIFTLVEEIRILSLTRVDEAEDGNEDEDGETHEHDGDGVENREEQIWLKHRRKEAMLQCKFG